MENVYLICGGDEVYLGKASDIIGPESCEQEQASRQLYSVLADIVGDLQSNVIDRIGLFAIELR